MTTEAALVKLMLLMGNFEDQNMIRKYFDQSLAGELGEN
jgi:L-asparaginase/Glu-tRNA(Gln) amidotransferase subunit D